jgi:transposase InsO family protein
VYTSKEFDQFCRDNNIRGSLGRTGICFDNAVSESFFATYKKELIHTCPRAEPKCSMERDPRRDDHAICTAVAPELVFTVRTYATNAPYGHPPSAQISQNLNRTRRSQPY